MPHQATTEAASTVAASGPRALTAPWGAVGMTQPAAQTWLDRLRGEPSPSTTALPYLDGIRAFAVVMVFVRHAWGLSSSPRLDVGGVSLAPFIAMFSTGVDLFFVLSGFLLARSFLVADFRGRPRPPTRAYLAQRILRIGPPYWLVLLGVVFFAVPSLIRPEAIYSREGAVVVLAHVFFGQTVYLPAFGSWMIETPFWTLTIEVTFYVLLPLVVRAFYRRRWLVSVPVALAVALGWLWLARYSLDPLVGSMRHWLYGGFSVESVRFFLSHTFPAHVLHFALGMAACNVVVRRELRWQETPRFRALTGERAGAVYLWLGALLVGAAMWRHGTSAIANGYAAPTTYMKTEAPAALEFYFLEGIPFAIGYALVVLGASLGPETVRRWLGGSWWCLFGVVGYSVYLLHMPILYHVNRLPWLAALGAPHQHLLALLATAGTAVLGLSILYYVAVERPSLSLARRVARRLMRAREGR